jgi:hypothetical protein
MDNRLRVIASMWNTPNAHPDAPNLNANQTDKPGSIGRQAELWPTPVANDNNKTPEAHLAMKQRMGERDGTGANRTAVTSLQVASELWATPTSHERTHDPRDVDHGEQLANQADQWGTPRASDEEKGGPNQSFGAGGVPLASQTAAWSTPATRDHKGGELKKTKQGRDLATDIAAFPSSPPAPATPAGPASSVTPRTSRRPSQRKRLNSYFVDWLMGAIPGWTNIEFTVSAPLGTEWFRCNRQRLSRFFGND